MIQRQKQVSGRLDLGRRVQHPRGAGGPDAGTNIYDPCCSSAGLLVACEHVLDDKMKLRSKTQVRAAQDACQEYVATTWAMANMNMIIHDMEGQIEIGDAFKNPKFRAGNRLQTFDRVVSNLMLVDYDHRENNIFEVTEEFYIHNGQHGTREDVVFVVNGIPVLVIECKNATKDEAIALGVGQIRRYHNEMPELFVPQIAETRQPHGFRAPGMRGYRACRTVENLRHLKQQPDRREMDAS